MNEKSRSEFLERRKEIIESVDRKEKIKEELRDLVEELKRSDIVLKMKDLGNEYLELEEKIKKIEELNNEKVDVLYKACRHPILYRVYYYERVNGSNTKVKKTDRENALYSKVRCLECSNYIYTIDKNTELDYHNLIYYNGSVARRVILDLPPSIPFDEVRSYYHEIMFDNKEIESIKKLLKKYEDKRLY